MRSVFGAALLALLIGVHTVAAQPADACAAVVRAAFASLALECANLPAESACLASGPPSDVRATALFETPGQRAPLDGLAYMSLPALNAETGLWGLALARPVGALGQGEATLVLLGGARLTNTGDPLALTPTADLTVTFRRGAIVREAPSEQSAQVALAFAQSRVRATGRTLDSLWVRVTLADGTPGWISAGLLDMRDADGLVVVTGAAPDPAGVPAPWQAFALATDAATCDGAPPGGVLVQAAPDATSLVLRVNDHAVIVTPGGTALLSAPEGTLRADVLAGQASVDGVRVEAGQFVQAGGAAARPYDLARYQALATLPTTALPQPLNFVALDFAASLLGRAAVDDACVLTFVAATNLRQQPSATSRVRFVTPASATTVALGQLEDDRGAVWYQLATDVWVAAEAVQAGAGCAG